MGGIDAVTADHALLVREAARALVAEGVRTVGGLDNSNYCVLVGSAGNGVCSMPCSQPTDCPAPTVCTDTGGANSVCLAPTTTPPSRGCAIDGRGDSAGRAAGGVGLLLVPVAVSLFRRRRRH